MHTLLRLSIPWLLGAACTFSWLSASTAKQKPTEIIGVVNINEATLAQLQLLPTIGPTKANAIVQHRKKHPFKKPGDLIKVKGIGKKSFDKIRALVVVTGATTLKKTPKTRAQSGH